MRILGIDPGSRITGYGVVEVRDHIPVHVSHGIVRLGVDSGFPVRMKELGLSLKEVFKKFQPQVVVIEKIFLGKNVDSAFKLGHARGVALYEAACFGATVIEYSTRLVKKGVTGSGAASKEDVQLALQRLLKIGAIAQVDASDALALAVYHSYQTQIDWTKQKAWDKARSL